MNPDHLPTARQLVPYRSEAETATAHALIALVDRLDVLIARLAPEA